MNNAEKCQIFRAGLDFLGWAGGSVHQVERELSKQVGEADGKNVHEKIKNMLSKRFALRQDDSVNKKKEMRK